MTIPTSSASDDRTGSDDLTVDQRWRRWEARGRQQDARRARRAGQVFWSAGTVATLAMVAWFLGLVP